MLLVIFAFLAFTFAMSSTLSKKYTSPILTLKENMSLASHGDLTATCEIDSQDEFGELADHFLR